MVLFLFFAFLFLITFFLILKNHQNYFKKRNIPFLNSIPIVGIFSDYILGKRSVSDCIQKIYEDPQFENEPFFGVFVFHKPAIFLKDPKLIKEVAAKNSNFFSDRTVTTNKTDRINGNMGKYEE